MAEIAREDFDHRPVDAGRNRIEHPHDLDKGHRHIRADMSAHRDEGWSTGCKLRVADAHHGSGDLDDDFSK
jgi:hypothetical protein